MKKSKKIVLSTVSPYNFSYPQLALYYLNTYFKKNNIYNHSLVSIDIDVFSANEKVPIIAKSLMDKKPDILGFSCYVWNITKILKIAKIIKRTNPDVKVILGGPEVSPRAEEVLRQEKSIDIIVRAEGEETFNELIKGLVYERIDLNQIKGITYRTKSAIFSNPTRPLIYDIDKIPSPYLEGLIDLKKGRKAMTETMRGCLYRCHYCYYHKDFDKIRYFSLERIEKELEFILAKEPSQVYFMDPTFNVNRKRAKEILRLFIKHNKNSTLHVELRAELLDEEMISLLHKSRTNFIEIGVQSTNPGCLKLINRTLERDIFKKNIKLLNRTNIYSEIQLVGGLPGDTYSDLKKSLDWLCSLCPPQIVIMRLMILPGTYLRHYAKTLGITYDPKPPYFTYKSSTMSGEDLKRVEQLRKAMEDLYNSALLKNTMYILKKKLTINFSDIFEEWIKWEKKSSSNAPHFVKYLCNKYKDSSIYKEIYPVLRGDLAKFMARIEIKKKQNFK